MNVLKGADDIRKSLIFSTFEKELTFLRCTEKKKEEFGCRLWLNKLVLFTLTKKIKCCQSPIIFTAFRVSSSEYMESFFNLEAELRCPHPWLLMLQHLRYHSPLLLITARLQNGLPKYCRILSHDNSNGIAWNWMYHFFHCCSCRYVNWSTIHQAG